jgi:hypothetical protein
MLFIHPAVVPADDLARVSVAEVRTVARPDREAVPRWDHTLELAQATGAAAPGATSNVAPAAVPGVGGTPPITNPAGGAVPPSPVGAAPPIPGPSNGATGNTYGTQQEQTGGANPTGTTAPVTPGVPGPGAGTGGSGGNGLAAPELATPPAGNMDNGASPYNSSGNGAGLTGTGMRTTAPAPTGGTTATPRSSGTTPAPVPSGSSGTR